jgi:hypothetical protein
VENDLTLTEEAEVRITQEGNRSLGLLVRRKREIADGTATSLPACTYFASPLPHTTKISLRLQIASITIGYDRKY